MANEQPQFERTRTGVRPEDGPAKIPSQRELAFKTFGVLNDGQQSKSSVWTALTINGTILLLVLLFGKTAIKQLNTNKKDKITYVAANAKPPEPPKPPPPPPKLPKPPIIKVEPPKIKMPTVEVPEPPKIPPPVVMKPTPVPIITPAAPKAVTPPPAPKPVAIQLAQAASVANNDAHPAAIRLGSQTNPINNTAGPAVSPVNLGRSGAAGMPAGNTGLGPPSKIAIGGSGSPNGSIGGTANAVQPIKGISTGVPGSQGTGSRAPNAVAIAHNNAPPPPPSIPQATPAAAKTAPKVLFKPKPVYTEEAKKLHLEGTVSVKIHVSSTGAVSVIGVQNGLGHGLDEAAVRDVQSMRFQPAMANGQPTDWDGVVSISFQLAD